MQGLFHLACELGLGLSREDSFSTCWFRIRPKIPLPYRLPCQELLCGRESVTEAALQKIVTSRL